MNRSVLTFFFPWLKQEPMTTKVLLKTSVYGIIYLNSGLFFIGFFFIAHPFAFGVLAGSAAALMKIWVFLEQLRRMEKKKRDSSASGYFLRYSIDALAMGITAFFSIQALLGCFFGTFSVKWVMILLSFALRNGGKKIDPQ